MPIDKVFVEPRDIVWDLMQGNKPRIIIVSGGFFLTPFGVVGGLEVFGHELNYNEGRSRESLNSFGVSFVPELSPDGRNVFIMKRGGPMQYQVAAYDVVPVPAGHGWINNGELANEVRRRIKAASALYIQEQLEFLRRKGQVYKNGRSVPVNGTRILDISDRGRYRQREPYFELIKEWKVDGELFRHITLRQPCGGAEIKRVRVA